MLKKALFKVGVTKKPLIKVGFLKNALFNVGVYKKVSLKVSLKWPYNSKLVSFKNVKEF